MTTTKVIELEARLSLLSDYAACVGEWASTYSDAKKQYGAKAYPYVPLSHIDFTALILRLADSLNNTRKHFLRFYQYANRLAHLYLLRELNNIEAYLVAGTMPD